MNPNVARMAWLLFMEIWKREAERKFSGVSGEWEVWAAGNYHTCIEVAETIEAMQNPKTNDNPLQNR